jgi:hypothetical protein
MKAAQSLGPVHAFRVSGMRSKPTLKGPAVPIRDIDRSGKFDRIRIGSFG